MYSTYVIKSIHFQSRYVGSTDNVEKRVEEHNNGKCRYTKGRSPWVLIYKEDFNSRSEAMKREKFLKSGKGRKLLDEKLKKIADIENKNI
ncbi:MAG: GIY-YIG nuclease family protein [Patescibacteria group bacterium]